MSPTVCVDASVALLWLLPTQTSPAADFLLEHWRSEAVSVVGPPLFAAEVTSGIRAAVYNRRISTEQGEVAFRSYQLMRVELVDHPDLQARAWVLARRFDRPKTYDMQYVALAEILDCQLWTADQKLVNALRGRVPSLRVVNQH